MLHKRKFLLFLYFGLMALGWLSKFIGRQESIIIIPIVGLILGTTLLQIWRLREFDKGEKFGLTAIYLGILPTILIYLSFWVGK